MLMNERRIYFGRMGQNLKIKVLLNLELPFQKYDFFKT